MVGLLTDTITATATVGGANNSHGLAKYGLMYINFALVSDT